MKFAKILAKSGDQRVLFIETNLRTPSLKRLFNINPADSPAGDMTDDGIKIFKLKNIGKGNLFAFTLGRENSGGADFLETKRFKEMIEISKRKFDYIIF